MTWDLPPKLWVPPRPAIIRPADKKLLRSVQASFMPGMFPGGAVGVNAAAAATISLVDTTSSGSSTTVPYPSGLSSGDLLLMYDFKVNMSSTIPTAVTPSGFTNIMNASSASPFGHRIMIHKRKADGTETGSVSGMTINGANAKFILAFRASTVPTTWDHFDIDATTGIAGDPTAQTVTSGSGTPPLIVFGFYGILTGTLSPRTFTPSKDAEISETFDGRTADSHYAAWKIYNDSPADVSIDMEDEGPGNFLNSLYMQATP